MKDVFAIMDKALRPYNELKYNRHMEKLHNLYKNAFDYINVTGPHKWSHIHCPERRYMGANLDLASLCADYYKRQPLIDAYLVSIMPIGHPYSWVVPSDIVARVVLKVLNPISKRQA
ncbi:hypothetical protein Ddye_029001 [Dipteronia dyeriana]|uniref:Uncharacterized protein n=1 Tax=Dipteronia dyeriana TaxID=168575 RepID=A0AAD9TDM0_9ROSI|nr:hypothetical protein Ddye_029001 [Dipteronia dyeriana]